MNTTDDNVLSATIAQLRELLTWQDGWNSYDALAPDPDAVSYAEQWITEVYQHIASTQQQWIEPNITGSSDGEVYFVWHHGQRKLSVYVDKQNIDYAQVWGRGVKAKITDGDINTIDDTQQLWQWLLETTQDEEKTA